MLCRLTEKRQRQCLAPGKQIHSILGRSSRTRALERTSTNQPCTSCRADNPLPKREWHNMQMTQRMTQKSNNNGDITSTTNWRETAWDQYLSELLWYASECKHSGFWAHFTNRGSRTERNRAAWLFWNAGRTTDGTWRDCTEWSVAASPRLWTAGWSQNGAVYGPCRTQTPQFNFDLALNRSISNLNDLELPGNAFTLPHTTMKGRQNSLSLLSPLWKSFKYI